MVKCSAELVSNHIYGHQAYSRWTWDAAVFQLVLAAASLPYLFGAHDSAATYVT